jgi:hypothetical protein
MSSSIRRVNEEAIWIINSCGQGINLQEAQTEIKKFQLLFEKMASIVNHSYDKNKIDVIARFVENTKKMNDLDPRCLPSIIKTIEIVNTKISRSDLLIDPRTVAQLRSQSNEEISKALGLNKWDGPIEAKNRIVLCFKEDRELLNLSCLNLSSLPDCLSIYFSNYFPNIELLDLSHNQLTTFTLQGASKLQELNLTNNQLSSFILEGTARLQKLYLSQNKLTMFSLQKAPVDLQVLHLESNQLSTFILQGASNLRSLFLQDNKLTTFTLQRAPQLQILNLDNNQLSIFTLQDVPFLKLLHIGNNNLNTFILTQATGLEILSLKNNFLTQAPNLNLYPKLHHPDLSDNPYNTDYYSKYGIK